MASQGRILLLLAGLALALAMAPRLAAAVAAEPPGAVPAVAAMPGAAPAALPLVYASVGDDLFAWHQEADGAWAMRYVGEQPARIYSLSVKRGQDLLPGREVMVLSIPGRSAAHVHVGVAGRVSWLVDLQPAMTIAPGQEVFRLVPAAAYHDSLDAADAGGGATGLPPWREMFVGLWQSTGIHDVYRQSTESFGATWTLGLGRVIMIAVGLVLLALAIFKGFEPLLLVPIGFGAVLVNIPLAGIGGPDGLLGMVYTIGIATGVFPLLIFMGVGAMTDFGPLIANPKTALLGAAAQFGIFFALLGALVISKFVPGIGFDLKDAASIGIIGGADGPTAIYLTSQLSPRLLGAIAVAAYSYMALVPIIQPPIMRLLTTVEDRKIRMQQLRHVSKLEKVCFPILITLLCALLLPDAAPLIGMLMFGNLMRECGVVERLSQTAQHALINIVTIFLGLAVGSKLSADKFLSLETLGILVLGVIAFGVGTATGLLFGQLMKKMSGGQVNPLIGAAGVSAVPMSARVVNKVGLEADPHNFLLMHAMGPNVAGVIGSAVAAGALLKSLAML
jgi:oxaloacetate decarboxylase beta subunit